MDKQMFEEMAKVIGETFTYAKKYYYDKYEPFELEVYPDNIASELYNAGYRKIPENAVVHIDRKLFNEIVNDILLSVKPVYLRKEIASKMLDLTNRLIVDTRKETAEKFAERMKEKLEENVPFVGFDLEYCEFDGETIQECIDEICKELKGE